MNLSLDDIARLNERARAVGVGIGWAMAFGQARNPEFVFVTADTIDEELEQLHIVVLGPTRVDDSTVDEVELFLDQLESGERRIVVDVDGDPRVL